MSSDLTSNGIDVLFEDSHCLFVSKPSGLLTQAPPGIDCLERRIKNYLHTEEPSETNPYLGVPHRLDRAASGVMVFAKTPKAARRLAEQFQGKTVEKTYWALLEGTITEKEGTWIDSMRKVEGEPRSELVLAGHPDAKQAILHFVNRGHKDEVTWMEIRLETGRNHQIRLQAASRQHPILGDQLYGSTLSFGVEPTSERLRAIALHARRLSLVHPTNRETVTVEAPLPEHWQSFSHLFQSMT